MTNAPRSSHDPRLRKLLLPAAALAFAWAIAAIVSGGIDTRIAGAAIRARGAFRPTVAGFALLAAYAALNRVAFRRLADRTADLLASVALPIAIAASLLLAAATVEYGSFSAGGADSFGYVSEAYGWSRGELPALIPLPYVLPFPSSDVIQIPLGYRSGPVPHTMTPTYAIGLPLLMAAGIRLGGACGPFLVTPICAAALVWFTFLLARRLAGPIAGALAAILVATAPIVLYQGMSAMSDVPAGAAWTAALWASLGGSKRHAGLAGVCAAIGLAIRPNILPLAVLIVTAATFSGTAGSRRSIRAALAAAPVAIAAIGIAALNLKWYGSFGETGYGKASDLYAVANIWPNLRSNLSWAFESESSWALVGVLAFLPGVRRFADVRAIAWAVAAIAVTLACYLPYAAFDAWWYLRFLLPAAGAAASLIAVGIVALAVMLPPPWGRLAACVTVVALVTTTLKFASSVYVFGPLGAGERRYIEIGEFVSRALPQNAAILAVQHSGSLRFYGGRMTLRFDQIDKGWEARAAGEVERAGFHPYLVLDDFELPQFRAQFGFPLGARLPFPIVARMRELGGTTVFDLASHALQASPTALEPGAARRCSGPGLPLRVH